MYKEHKKTNNIRGYQCKFDILIVRAADMQNVRVINNVRAVTFSHVLLSSRMVHRAISLAWKKECHSFN